MKASRSRFRVRISLFAAVCVSLMASLPALGGASRLVGVSSSGEVLPDVSSAGVARGLAGWMQLEGLASVATLAGGAGLALGLDVGSPIQLLPSTAGQTIDLFLSNSGANVDVGGFDLKVGLSGPGGPAPAITSVDLRAGSVFTVGNSVQSFDAANTGLLQFWSVSVNDPFSPPTLAGGGSLTKIGTLTISTLGVSSGQWLLSAVLPESSLVGPFGDSLPLTVGNSTLEVGGAVPELSVTLPVSGAALLAWVVARKRSRAARLQAFAALH